MNDVERRVAELRGRIEVLKNIIYAHDEIFKESNSHGSVVGLLDGLKLNLKNFTRQLKELESEDDKSQ